MPVHSRYQFDSKASQFTVHAFANGLAVVVAHHPKFAIRDFSGEAQFKPPALEEASLRIKIKVASLELIDEVSEYDRAEIGRIMFNEVLEASRFPEIVYQSNEIVATRHTENSYATNITGNLTLHGLTHKVSFPAQVVAGEDSLRGYGNFTVRQTDFGMSMAPIAGGTIKMQDELKISFFIVAKKQG